MKTNIVLHDEIVKEAFSNSGNIKTKKALVQVALEKHVANRKRKTLKELRRKISFQEDYDYKSIREGS